MADDEEQTREGSYLNDNDIDNLNCLQLKNYLRQHNQYVTGRKSELIARAKGVSKMKIQNKDEREWAAQIEMHHRKTEKLITPCREVLPDPKSLKSWSNDISFIPNFTEIDIYNYLVLKMNCKRQLRSVVYLEDKHVHSVCYHPISEHSQYCFIKCNVIPSLPDANKKRPDHDVWVCMAKVSGQIHSAECDCTIGTAESCNHIGALLHTLAAITVKKKDGTLAVTSQKCLWNDPRKRKHSPKKSCDLVFKKYKFIDCTDSCTHSKGKDDNVDKSDLSCKSSVNIERFKRNLAKVNPKAGWLLNFVQSDVKVDTVVSLCLNISFMYHDSVNLKSEKVKMELKEIFNSMKLDEKQTKQIEQYTRGQTNNTKWIKERSFRITSSNFGHIVKCKQGTEPDGIIKRILYSNFHSKYTEWGKNHEPAARMKYKLNMKQLYKDVKVELCGLFVSCELPHLGASPDGIVTYTDNNNVFTGLLEIKCPASDTWRMMRPQDCARDNSFFCSKDNGKCVLKKTHPYYFQVQGQLALSGYQWCDFIVWTLNGISVERIKFDNECWEKVKDKLNQFYLDALLPELFSLRVKRGLKLFH